MRLSLFGIIITTAMGCSSVSSQEQSTALSQEFKDYWYSGEAELTRYELEQARYGEIHRGDAVLIFVTEDFRKDKQVKYESGNRDDITSVLKLNFTRKFITGIYPYSLMSSVFTPVNDTEPTLKITTSSQEWCGHSFSQLNFRQNKYHYKLYSYFQDEGDQSLSINKVMLEDEIWTKIRMQPSSLPLGSIRLAPGTQFLRFNHREFAAEEATATLEKVIDPELSADPLYQYQVEYLNFNRILKITFEVVFPHHIVVWEEQTQNSQGQILTTKAKKTHSISLPYWQKNSTMDTVLRQELGLD
jgi:hypothetical protein